MGYFSWAAPMAHMLMVDLKEERGPYWEVGRVSEWVCMCVRERVFMHRNSPWVRVLVPRKGGHILETLGQAAWFDKVCDVTCRFQVWVLGRWQGNLCWCGDNEELVEFKRSVFYHMLSIIRVLYTAVISRLSVASASCNSLLWEVSKHSGFYFCKLKVHLLLQLWDHFHFGSSLKTVPQMWSPLLKL